MSRTDQIAAAAAAVALLSLVGSIVAIWYSRRSANETRRLRRIEDERFKHEKSALHRSLRPVVAPEIDAKVREPESLLYGTLTVPEKPYRVRAYAKQGPSLTALSLAPLTVPGRLIEFVIETWHPDREKPLTEEIFFHFWWPEPSDQVPVWDCPCGYEPPREMTGDAGHWVCQVKVTYRLGPEPLVTFR